MALGEFEVRLLAAAMLFAFLGAIGFGFAPSFRKRRDGPPGTVRDQRGVPRAVEAGWALVPFVLLAAPLGVALFPGAIAWSPINLMPSWNPALSISGVGIYSAGAALTGLSGRHLGRQLTVVIEVREGGQLVTSGPYARVRHPIYTGLFLSTGGLALALAAPGVVGVLAIALYCGNFRARLEEQLLASDAGFGFEYSEYLKRTGRFLPRLS